MEERTYLVWNSLNGSPCAICHDLHDVEDIFLPEDAKAELRAGDREDEERLRDMDAWERAALLEERETRGPHLCMDEDMDPDLTGTCVYEVECDGDEPFADVRDGIASGEVEVVPLNTCLEFGGDASRAIDRTDCGGMDVGAYERALEDRFGDGRGRFLWSCSMAPGTIRDSVRGLDPAVAGLWSKSASMDTFLDAVHHCDDLMYGSQLYAELGRQFGWEVPVSPQADEYRLPSDAGGVLVGDVAGTSAVLLPNGYGDGETRVVVAGERGLVNTGMMEDAGMVSGDTQVYGYDCADLAPATDESLVLHGRYHVYCHGGTVVFER